MALSFSFHGQKAAWLNVPPPMTGGSVGALSLGDKEMAYRAVALMLQNIGNTGGRNERFEAYDYDALKNWMIAGNELDARSDVLPVLAAYYYSATPDKAQLSEIVDYLEIAGDLENGQKWRWAAQAAYIARFKMEDPARALEIAKRLNTAKNPLIAPWARQMVAIIVGDMGEKQVALGIMLELIETRGQELSPQELFVMKEYMCRELIEPQNPAYTDFCEGL